MTISPSLPSSFNASLDSGTGAVTSQFVDPSKVIIHTEPSCTVQHWQLRDLVQCCQDDPTKLYYVNHRSVYRYDTITRKSTLVQSVDFTPVSMSVNNGYLVTGGHEAQLSVKSLSDNEVIRTYYHIGGTINNGCHISSHLWTDSPLNNHRTPRLFVSNNDNTVKVYKLPSLALVQSFEMGVACNFTSTTRDGKLMASVSDQNDLFLYDISSLNGSTLSEQGTTTTTTTGESLNTNNINTNCRLIAKMQEYTDGGFSCTFDPTGTKLAAASQDGTVVVWDLRNTRQCLRKFEGKQKEQRGACRNVKFSPVGCIDLLIFSEHESYVHIVDMRTFEHQILSVSDNIPSEIRSNRGTNTSSNTFGVIGGSIGGETETRRRTFLVGRSSINDICGIDFNCDSSSIFVGLTDLIQEYPVDLLKRRSFAKGSMC